MSWTGVYKDRRNLPKSLSNNDHDFQAWVDKQLNRIKNLDKELHLIKSRNSFFIDLLNQYNKPPNVLDFGGSLGTTFFSVSNLVNKYYIVETEKIVNAGNNLEIDNLTFFNSINHVPLVDVVHIRTSLQYSHNWRKTLEELLTRKPSQVILSHLSAGDIDTFLTIQNWGDMKIPYWFINLNEIKTFFLERGFKLMNEQDSSILKECPKTWESICKFPKSKRLEKTIDISFSNE
jgi:putative methyltransferase (TIGR04325 family)